MHIFLAVFFEIPQHVSLQYRCSGFNRCRILSMNVGLQIISMMTVFITLFLSLSLVYFINLQKANHFKSNSDV